MFGKFIVDSSGEKVRTEDFDPNDTLELTKDGTREDDARLRKRLRALQDVLYASKKRALLIVLQGMDSSGKDGTVKKVLADISPTGFNVEAFKVPTPAELLHDYLWRVHQKTPQRGDIVVLNRSYYEDVLVTRVHGMVDDETAHRRFSEIRNFEDYLTDNDTVVLKFFLHISKDFQREKLLKRLECPEKNWKFSASDLEERKCWDDYQRCYGDVLSHTSTKRAPWHVVPANHRWFRDYFILHAVVHALEEMHLEYPVLEDGVRHLMRELREEQ